MFRSMPVRGAVTTSNVSAREAQAQMDPACADLEAIFASLRARLHLVDLVQVSTFRHKPSGRCYRCRYLYMGFISRRTAPIRITRRHDTTFARAPVSLWHRMEGRADRHAD